MRAKAKPKSDPAAMLAAAGLKCTRPRLEVLTLLLGAPRPLSHQQVRQKLFGLDAVTVYRVLDSLHGRGIVHRIESRDRVWRFAVDACGHKDHCHPHFSCRGCGGVECLEKVALPRWKKPKKGYTVEGQEVYLYGTCNRCASR